MKTHNFAFILLLFLWACNPPENIQTGQVSIIPLPNEINKSEGQFLIRATTSVAVENESQLDFANRFFSAFEPVSGWQPQVQLGTAGNIIFQTNVELEAEAYTLEVGAEQVVIKASQNAGFFYALESLRQLLPPSFYSGELQPNVVWAIPAVKIEDAPAFAWRGFMLDVSRHFFTVDQVKEVLDFMVESKLNRFHWHLADDQGWRVEIKSYPKLTEIGAWRMDYNNTDESISDWWGRPAQKPGEKASYGGFYTQEEIKEIVAYAKERFIEVIPEIDMPGHAQATIAAYPEIGCVNALPYVATGGVFKNNTYNPGKEVTFEFAEKMLNEIMDLFPFKYVHIGGDECNKEQWKIDPDAQRRIKEEGLENEEELQSYFIKRIEKIINERDRIMIGWDEILEGGLAPNATVMSWRGEAGGLASVKAGHEVIMTPNSYCYIDLKQGHDDLEPNLGYSRLLLSKAYSYQVIPNDLSAEEGQLIKGVQANLWTESISDWSKLTYMTFPRVYAIAENGWTQHEQKDWDDFTQRLLVQFERLEAQDIRYAVSAFSPWIHHEGKDDGIEIKLTTEANGLAIHYTLDGSEPDTNANQYTEPFLLTEGATINAQAFLNGEKIGYRSSLDFPIHLAAGIFDQDEDLNKLSDLNYARLTNADKNWLAFREGMEVLLPLEEATEVHSLDMNALRFTISGVYPPTKVQVLGSTDGQDFEELGAVDLTETSFIQGRNKIPIKIPLKTTTVKWLKIIGKEINPIPQDHHAAGRRAVIKVDELVLE